MKKSSNFGISWQDLSPGTSRYLVLFCLVSKGQYSTVKKVSVLEGRWDMTLAMDGKEFPPGWR